MFLKLVIVALLVLALSMKVEGACDPNACDSERTRLLNTDTSNHQEVCQPANAFLDCAKGLHKDCGADYYACEIEHLQNMIKEAGCAHALSMKAEGACDPNACDSEATRLRSTNTSNLQEVCQPANAFLDCAKGLHKDCGADYYACEIEHLQNMIKEAGCAHALSMKAEGACDPNACDSEATRLRSTNTSNLQEVCQPANAFLDCAKGLHKDCGADYYACLIKLVQHTIKEAGCAHGSAGKLFVCSPLLILLLFLSKSVN